MQKSSLRKSEGRKPFRLLYITTIGNLIKYSPKTGPVIKIEKWDVMKLEIMGLVQKGWSYPHINSYPQRKKKKQKERKDYDYYYYISCGFLHDATGEISQSSQSCQELIVVY